MQKEIPTQEVKPTETTTTQPETIVEDTVEDVEEGKSDPLDALLENPEALLSEAKKYRGIASRKEKKTETKPVSSEVTPDSPYVTREELYAENRNKVIASIENVSDNDPQADFKRELNDNWQDVMTYYVARNGQKTPDDIMKDIRAAYVVWKDATGGSTDDSVRNLQTTRVGQPAGGIQPIKKAPTDVSDDPRFNKPKPVDQWYPKKD